MYLKCRCKETKIKPFDFWKERKAETRKIWLKLWNIINQVHKKLKKYNIANSPQKPLSDITDRFALPNCPQVCYQLRLLKLMKWGGGGEGNVTLLLFMEEETQNINVLSKKSQGASNPGSVWFEYPTETARSFSSKSTQECSWTTTTLSTVETTMLLPGVLLPPSGDGGCLLCYQADSIAAVNLKSFFRTSTDSFLWIVSRNT